MKTQFKILLSILPFLVIFFITGVLLVGRRNFDLFYEEINRELTHYTRDNYPNDTIADILVYKNSGKFEIVECIEASQDLINTYSKYNDGSVTTIVSKQKLLEEWNDHRTDLLWKVKDIDTCLRIEEHPYIFSIKLVDPNDYTKVYLWMDSYNIIREDITTLKENG